MAPQNNNTKSKSQTSTTASPQRTMISIVVILLLIACALAAAFLYKNSPPQLPVPKPTPVTTTTLEQAAQYTFTQNYTGRIEARSSIPLSFEHQGRLISINAHDGQAITKDAIIAQLDTATLQAERADHQARHDAAFARYQELQQGPRIQTINQAEAETKRAKASLDRLTPRLISVQEAFKLNAASKDELDDAIYEKTNAEALYELAIQKLSELQAGSREEQIDAQHAEVQALEARITLIELQIKNSTLRAPFHGRINRLIADVGSVLQPGQPIATFIEDSHLEAWVGLPPSVIPQLTAQNDYQVTIALKNYPATFVAVMPQLDNQTRTVQVAFNIQTPDKHTVFPGQIARLQINQTINEPGFWLPTSALIKGHRGLWATYIVTPPIPPNTHHTASYTDIELLYTQNDRAFVRGILQNGQTIISAGAQRIAPGSPVIPTKQSITITTDPK